MAVVVQTRLKKALNAYLESRYLNGGAGENNGKLYANICDLMYPLGGYYRKNSPQVLMLNYSGANELTEKNTIAPCNNTADSVVIGFADNSKENDANSKKGKRIIPKDTHSVLDYVNAGRVQFGLDKAVGESTMIARVINADKHRGICIAEDLSIDTNVYGVAYENYYYARPGITGITSDEEILLGKDTPLARYKKNLVTGELTQLNIGDDAYNFPLGQPSASQVYLDGYFYYFLGQNYNYLAKYNVATKSIETYNPSVPNNDGSGIVTDGTYLYCLNGVSTSNITIYKYGLNLLQVGSVDIKSTFPVTNYNEWYTLGGDGTNYYIAFCRNVNDNYQQSNAELTEYTAFCYKFSDINNVQGSIIEVQGGVCTANTYLIDKQDGNGEEEYKLLTKIHSDGYRYIQSEGYQMRDYANNTYTLKVIKPGYWGNMLEFAIYTQEEIQSGDNIKEADETKNVSFTTTGE